MANSRPPLAWLRRHLPLVVVILIYGLVIVFINPIRDRPMYDDWGYAWSVDTLLRTGLYVQHNWTIPSCPALIVWGALFVKLFGFSFSTLRISSLVLTGVLLAATYFLALEHDIDPPVAGLLAVLLLASPLVLDFAFTFMTDLPFMAVAMLAVLFYTRAIKRDSLAWMIAGGAAAVGAVFIRQVGAAFVPALAIVWLVSAERRRMLPRAAVGIAPPLLATAWQIYAGLKSPCWICQWQATAQVAYLASPGTVALETLWRLMAVMQYLAMFALPLAVAAVIDYAQKLRQASTDETRRRTETRVLAGLAVFMIGAILMGVVVLKKPGLMPLLAANLWYLAPWPPIAIFALTVVTVTGGFSFARLILVRYLDGGWRRIEPHEVFLDLVSLFLLAINILWFFYTDRYPLPVVPFALIIIGRGLLPLLKKHFAVVSGAALVALAIFANTERTTLSSLDAASRAGDALLERGVPAANISVDWAWDSYHGAFDEFMQGSQPDLSVLGTYFGDWLRTRTATVDYVVTEDTANPYFEGWDIVEQTEYPDFYGQAKKVVAFKRPGSPAGP